MKLQLAVVAFALGANSRALTAPDVDHLLEIEWKKHHVTPAPPADDARFLRRLYLDLLGTIPSPEAVLAFLNEKSADKRTRAVERLIESRRFIDHWTDYWEQTLLGRDVRDPQVDREAFRAWLRSEIEKNTGYDRIVRQLLAASGKNSGVKAQQLPPQAQAQGQAAAQPQAPKSANASKQTAQQEAQQKLLKQLEASPVNGAVNWLAHYQPNPPDLAGRVARLFLGTQIQCAECHDHPYENWSQEDFRKLAACFSRTQIVALGDGKPIMGVKRVVLRDVENPTFGGANTELAAIAKATPTALDGTDLSATKNRRAALADWLTAKTNRAFARALVNRLWAHFLGRGFFDPVDDLRSASPIEGQAVLDRLTDDFITSGYDLKHLIRIIASTRAYQLSSSTANGKSIVLWSRQAVRPLGPDELLEALVRATNLESAMWLVSGGNLDRFKAQMKSGLGFVFDIDETKEQTEFEGTVPQMLLLMNGSLVTHAASDVAGTALEDVLALPVGDGAKIEALYLRALSRKPAPEETKAWLAYLEAPRDTEGIDKKAKGPAVPSNMGRLGYVPDPIERAAQRLKHEHLAPKQEAYEDLFWALFNSTEFFFRH
jgi:hypothetical protein